MKVDKKRWTSWQRLPGSSLGAGRRAVAKCDCPVGTALDRSAIVVQSGLMNPLSLNMRWSRGLGCVIALLSFALAAHAGPLACAPEIVGPWTGQVLDAGRIKELRTQFSTRSDGLNGTYHVEDADGGYDGTLTDFTSSGACAGQFLWHDRHGTGVVRIEFRPDRDRFDGQWGEEVPFGDHIFTGRRYRPAPVS
jgi:hypothetical protein